ncbi:MAG: CoA-binding protein [Burkholderiales bacterium RIFCSPLOWO2_02_FULL_57_36]|nr:MAG: CoA-binding protein [Burkholderiales bacterium RIFCSPLOWO2_02_FULL_57_36]
MTKTNNSIPDILQRSRTIAVVGLSAKTSRPSHEVADYLQQNGYRIIPVNPAYAGTYILDEYCYASLQEAASALSKEKIKIDIVDCFRKSDAILPIAEEAIAIGAPCLWMQLGVVNEEAAARARENGLEVVMDRCLKIEHMHAFKSG